MREFELSEERLFAHSSSSSSSGKGGGVVPAPIYVAGTGTCTKSEKFYGNKFPCFYFSTSIITYDIMILDRY